MLSANGLLQRSADTSLAFRQDSNFWYLTGLNEPDLLFFADEKGEEFLVLPERDEHRNLWDGPFNEANLTYISGVKNFINFARFKQILGDLKSRNIKVARPQPPSDYLPAYGMYTNPARANLEKVLKKFKLDLVDCRLPIARLRAIKQGLELVAIQSAIDITLASLRKIKKNITKFASESEIARNLSVEFIARGATGHAFDSIVAIGQNAATIHHRSSASTIKQNRLLLLDVGAEVNNYAADISRTWEIGEPSKKQQTAVVAIREVQDFAFSLLKPGLVLRDYAKEVRKFAAETYLKYKLINSKQQIDEVMPHAVSHFMGLDVHDAGDYDLPLAANMVLTVEPGIYLPGDGIGARIEDDALITKNGAKWLSRT